MSGQQIMEALNLLDDDLIAATDRQRSKKVTRHWVLPVAMVACLCLAILTTNTQSKAAPEADRLANDYSSISDGAYGALMDAAGNAESTTAVRIRVTQITDTGFVGNIENNEQSGDCKEETIEIHCDIETLAALKTGDLLEVRYSADQMLIDFRNIQE